MNKKQFYDFHNIKNINAFLKKNNCPSRLYAEKNIYNDYELKWQCEAGNLPDKLAELKNARQLRDDYLKAIKEQLVKGSE